YALGIGAFRYQDGTYTSFGPSTGEALDISDSGGVIGFTNFPNSSLFYYDATTTNYTTQLKAINDFITAPHCRVNSAGNVVGVSPSSDQVRVWKPKTGVVENHASFGGATLYIGGLNEVGDVLVTRFNVGVFIYNHLTQTTNLVLGTNDIPAF